MIFKQQFNKKKLTLGWNFLTLHDNTLDLFSSLNNLTSFRTRSHPTLTELLTPTYGNNHHKLLNYECLLHFHLLINGVVFYSIPMWPEPHSTTFLKEIHGKKRAGYMTLSNLLYFLPAMAVHQKS